MNKHKKILKKRKKRSTKRYRSPWSILKSNFKRANQYRICYYCQIDNNIAPKQSFDVEHLKPKKHFPELELDIDNLTFACVNCNRSKGAKHPYLYTGVLYQRHPCDIYPSDSITS